MSARIKYTDEELGDIQVVPDFLPPPEELAFKKEARKHNTQYQKMIRRLLDVYSSSYKQRLTKRSTGRAKKRRAG